MKLNEAIEVIEDVSSSDYFRSIDATELTDWQDVAFTLYTEYVALKEYATHKPGCYENNELCICGLDALLKEQEDEHH